MVNLSHWIFAKDFTGHDAAHLILGIDPSTDTDSRRTGHINERLQDAFAGALENLGHDIFVVPCLSDDMDEIPPRLGKHETLQSVEMDSLLDKYINHGDDVSIKAWLERGRNSFLEQRFSRVELARWIVENHLVSHYPFTQNHMLKNPENTKSSSTDKPLTNRERDTLLTIIAVLCKEAKLDHTTCAKTAGLIQSTATGMRISIGETTIENHLKKIPDALAGRIK